MGHILGIPHSLGGVVNAISNTFGNSVDYWTPQGFGDLSPPPPPPVIIDGGSGMIVPPPGGGGGCGPAAMVFDPAANCGLGKWRKKTRRRRKRLATKSDIADLSSLKTVLGGGKAFENWIATRGR